MAEINWKTERDMAGDGPLDVAPTLVRRVWANDISEMFPDSLDQLQAVKALADWIELRQKMVVSDARAAGKTWQQIADALGITRQAAQKRYGYMG